VPDVVLSVVHDTPETQVPGPGKNLFHLPEQGVPPAIVPEILGGC
jgi:hypothetical protein